MPKPGTSQIVLESLTHVARCFRTIRDLGDFQRAFPFRTVSVEDEVAHLSEPMPDGYTEHRLYLMDGPLQLATIDLAFCAGRGLVNFSLFIIPREWFKRKAVKNCVASVVFPFLRQNYPDAKMAPQMFGTYLFPDPGSGLTFQLRPHADESTSIGIGVAIMDSEHV